jgi:hypothetical protein
MGHSERVVWAKLYGKISMGRRGRAGDMKNDLFSKRTSFDERQEGPAHFHSDILVVNQFEGNAIEFDY